MPEHRKTTKEKVAVIIFEGGAAASPVEEVLVSVRHALLLDNLEKFISSPLTEPVYLVTDCPELARDGEALGAIPVRSERTMSGFSFGRELQRVVQNFELRHVFYLGGGGAPLLSPAEINEICLRLLAGEKVILSNNSQSADMTAFTPASLLLTIPPPIMDNTLGLDLQQGTGIAQELLPLSLGTIFDLDTPSDLLVLAVTAFVGERARKKLASLKLDTRTITAARRILAGHCEEVLLLGRVGAPVIARINSTLKVRLRVFSEERGMKALGRIDRGEVVSMMGYFLAEAGIKGFFDYINRVAACAFIDSRVIFAHNKLNPSVADRFYSDLGLWQKIKDPFIREFTRAAQEAPLPVMLGGHSLVSGGLWALTEDIGCNI